MSHHRLPPQRVEQLRETLQPTVDLLHRRRAAQIPADDLDDCVTLDWLKWDGGSLRLTTTGENILRQQQELSLA